MDNKLILIPGTFNPPTKAHIEMSRRLHSDYPDSEICYVIANSKNANTRENPQKLLPMNTRAKLLLDAIDGTYASVSLFESSEKSDRTIITTARFFRDKGYDVTLCIGSDNVSFISDWYEGLKLAEEFNFIVFCRNSDDTDVLPMILQPVKNHFVFKDGVSSSVSASDIRNASVSGNLDRVKDDIPENVYEFLCKNPY